MIANASAMPHFRHAHHFWRWVWQTRDFVASVIIITTPGKGADVAMLRVLQMEVCCLEVGSEIIWED